jgi:LCP family protein required for cell wall assembly
VSGIGHDGPGSEEERDPDTPESVEPGEPPAAPDAGGGDDSAPETGESSGLGLTDEFARIEAEIAGDEEGAEQPGPDRAEPSPPTDEEWVVAEGQATADSAGPPAEADLPGQGESAEHDPTEPSDPIEASEASEATDPTEAGESADAHPSGEAEESDETRALGEAAEPAAGAADLTAAHAAGAGQRPDETAAVGAPTTPPPVVRASKPPPAPVAPALTDEELESVTSNLWLRFLSGSVLIVASIAASVAVVGLLFVEDIAAKLQPIPGISEQLAAIEPDDPQTILIIGSDRRAGDDPDAGARSDTTMLLRVDADKDVLSLFSLPRDLKVDVPGVGPAKLNEAYAAGGEKKTLKTVKRFTGLEINHVVEINFTGFADAVDAIECVYVDIDREYFNVNDGTAANDYAEIDINAGYQRLCGLKALQYVRYRHFDTDLVRAARQQDFLREARQKVEPRELLGAVAGIGIGTELIDIFTEYTRSDIDSAADVLGILKSFAAVREVPVNEVHFEGDIGGPDDPFVTSTDNQVQQAIDEFLNGVGSTGQRGGEKSNKKKGKGKKKDKKKGGGDGADVVATDALADDKFPTLADRFKADADKNARRLGIPVFYPTAVVPGSTFGTDSRTYEYENEDNKKESAYKTVIALTTPTTLTEYYGLMGTTWEDPPILRNPSEVRKIDGREYLLFYDGGRLRLVGWKEKGNSYWLNNTLLQSIGEAEMLAMATSIRGA